MIWWGRVFMELNLANKLTLLRVILIPIFLIVLLGNWIPTPINRYVAVFIFIIASLTDMLDGKIARKWNMVTNLGKFMDPLADKLLVSAALISMVQLGDLSAWIVIVIISREFIITGFRLIAVEANIVIAASWWGKIKTTTQMIMIVYVLLGLQGFVLETIEGLLVALATLFTIISGIDYMMKNLDVLKS